MPRRWSEKLAGLGDVQIKSGSRTTREAVQKFHLKRNPKFWERKRWYAEKCLDFMKTHALRNHYLGGISIIKLWICFVVKLGCLFKFILLKISNKI